MTAGQIGDRLRFPTAQTAQHLRFLRESGLANMREQGTRRLYRLDDARLRAVSAFIAFRTKPRPEDGLQAPLPDVGG